MVVAEPTTAGDLLRLADDDRRELLAGELLPMSPTGYEHFETVGALMRFLAPFVAEHRLGAVGAEGGFLLRRDPDTVLAPDVAFVSEARRPPPGRRHGFPALAPDLAVEIVSPGDTVRVIQAKIRVYLEAGVRLLWIVDPDERTVTVYTPDRLARILIDGETLDGGDVLPGFSVPVAAIFA